MDPAASLEVVVLETIYERFTEIQYRSLSPNLRDYFDVQLH